MTSVLECPSSDRLLALIEGVLSEPEQAAIVRHLDDCGPCQPALECLGAGGAPFAVEARAAAAVSNEHVVPIYSVDEFRGLPYLVMPLIASESLQDRLDRCGPLKLPEILRIGRQAAIGLAAAHAQGLIHRDIKPSNILLENGVERVKITDFGLARTVDDASLTHSDVVVGTPQYMAPEQARGEPVDPRSDL